ncbi:sigma-54-dependent Fis family transcriptional regulator [candidate division KSB1 bacterium]|nr:sigma-54-dependent Fis family transcriptional regulator [candidate division KSB1 bacterium]
MYPTTNPPDTLLIVDDTPTNIGVLFEYLTQRGFKVLVAQDGESALEQLQFSRPDLILLDVLMPGIDGFETCRRLKAQPATKDIPVIFMTALTETVDKVRGFEAGAVDYITKPIQHEELLARVTAHLTIRKLQESLIKQNEALQREIAERERLHNEKTYLQEEIKTHYNFEEIIGVAPAMQKVFQNIERVAATDTTVLITGETGTGKELVARAIHNRSARKSSALIKVNCAALPSGLIESELFGHEKGAFTGATAKKKGRFELADGGTIFLDEVGELPLETQVKLLRVLQEQEFETVGGAKTIKVNVRVIAATNRNLQDEVKKGAIRSDLFFRLNIFPIHLPALRERSEDISLLADYFMKRFAAKTNKQVNVLSPGALDLLKNYSWAGNVRELANVIERAVILCDERVLAPKHLNLTAAATIGAEEVWDMEEVERQHILKALKRTRGQVGGANGAAQLLGVNRTTLIARMKKLGIGAGETSA